MTEKRALLVRALTQIGEALAKAPTPGHMERSADALLDLLLEGPLMVTVERDPTADDGLIDYCHICQDEPHGANCPVGLLEALLKVGVDSDTPLPARFA
jgi:hypothetical protein